MTAFMVCWLQLWFSWC